MTEKLKHLMHERAALPEFARPDVDRLVSAGTRRAYRRRMATAAGGIGATAVVGALALAVVAGDGDPDVATATPPSTSTVTWATGSTLHTPDGSFELGRPIAAYVRTSVGYVFTDGGGGVYSAIDGDVTRVGDIATHLPHLVADGDGPLVAWVDPSKKTPQFVVLDQRTNERTEFGEHTDPGMGDLADEKNPAYVYGIDGGTAYWRDQRGAVAVDVDTGDTRVIDATARNGFDILAVEDGVIAFNAGDAGTTVGTSRDTAVTLPDAYGSLAVFSPAATWVSVDADDPQVYEVRTGQRVDLDIDGRWFATGYEWLDEETLAVIAARDESSDYELLTCSAVTGRCETAVPDAGKVGAEDFVLPVGETRED